MAKIRKWEILGAVITIVFGSLLHFVFVWSGGNKAVALIGAVNESTWEHLKLAFWPAFTYAVIEWFVWGKRANNFCLATFVKLFSMPLTIIALFYGWLALFPDNFIWDILIFVAAVIIGYILGYQILKVKRPLGWEKIAVILILVGLVKFSLFTYFPPYSFITKDPVKDGYGIEN